MSGLDLLLIGKTGNGKSATGNTILGRRSFKSSPNFTSVTKHAQSDYSEYKGRIIKVVDGPGIGDTDLSKEDALNLVINAMRYAIAENPKGYHAFLLVVRYGGRFTEEDKQTIYLLKHIFGNDFVSKYCILVMTCGDNFDPDETGSTSFSQWCAGQTGEFQFLLTECKGRIVLFDNKTKDKAKITRQIDELIWHVDSLNNLQMRYTDDQFRAAEILRNKAIVDAKRPMIQDESIKEASLILQQISNVQFDDPDKRIAILKSLHRRADNHLESVRNQDNNTGSLADIIKNAHHIVKSIEDQIESTEKAKKLQEIREENLQKFEALRVEREKLRQAEEEKRQAELEKRIKELQEKDEANKAKLRAMELKLQEQAQEVQDEYMEAKESSFWDTILSIGAELLVAAVPKALSFLKKLVTRG